MRTSEDLINELDAEREKFSWVAIAVGFEQRTDFVFASRADRLTALNEAVKAGGEPFGLIGIVKDSEHLWGYTRPFKEYATETWVEEYLRALMSGIGKTIGAECGIEPKDGWIH